MEFGRYNWRKSVPMSRISKQNRPVQCRPTQYTRNPSMYNRNYYDRDCTESMTRCFKCSMVGHIAKDCRVQIKKILKRNKSQKKKDRDHRRLQEFRSRKSVCVVMPFYNVSDAEMIAFMPKWSVSQQPTRFKKVLSVINVPSSDNSKLVLENTQLSSALENSSVKIQNLESALNEKEKEIFNLQGKFEAQIADMEILKRRIGDKEFLVGFLEEQFNLYRDEAERLKKELSAKSDKNLQPQLTSLEIMVKLQKIELTDVKTQNNELQTENAALLDEQEELRRNLYNGPDYGHQQRRRYYNRRR